eukprot:528433-Amphidinium_carterae.2
MGMSLQREPDLQCFTPFRIHSFEITRMELVWQHVGGNASYALQMMEKCSVVIVDGEVDVVLLVDVEVHSVLSR